MHRPRRPRLALLPLLLTLLVSGCSGLSGTGGQQYVAGDGQVLQVEAADRGAPVEMSGTTLDGKRLSLSDYRGQVVVVNVWWSGCPPCRTEMPTLVKAASSDDHAAAYVGINIRDGGEAQAEAFVRRFHVPYPTVFDPSGKALLPFAGTLSPRSVPATVILDPQGRIAASVIGPLPSPLTLTELIDDAAAGSHGTADG